MTKADKLIFWGVLSFALVSFVFINVFIFSGTETAVIEVDKKPYAEYKLKDLTSPVTLEIDTGSGYNKIEITTNPATAKFQKADKCLYVFPIKLLLKS